MIRSMGVDFIALMFLGDIETMQSKSFCSLLPSVFYEKWTKDAKLLLFVDTGMPKVLYLRP